MKITKIILYWIMVAAIVTGAVYSYQKVQFGRKIAMLYQMATGNTAMGGPGGGPPGGGQMDMGRGGQPGMRSEGGQRQFPGGEGGTQGPPQMGQDIQGGRPDFQEGGRQGGPPGGMGPGGSKWYKISLRNVGPYTCLLVFFILITCIIENCIKRFSRSESACLNNAA